MSKLWLTETENMIEAIKQERQALSDEYEKLGTKLVAKDEELTHLVGALQTYQRR